jgi:hypothetical protein
MIIGPNDNRVAAAHAWVKPLAAAEAAMTSRTHPSLTGKATLASRSRPAGGRRKLPQVPGHPRKAMAGKSCSRR